MASSDVEDIAGQLKAVTLMNAREGNEDALSELDRIARKIVRGHILQPTEKDVTQFRTSLIALFDGASPESFAFYTKMTRGVYGIMRNMKSERPEKFSKEIDYGDTQMMFPDNTQADFDQAEEEEEEEKVVAANADGASSSDDEPEQEIVASPKKRQRVNDGPYCATIQAISENVAAGKPKASKEELAAARKEKKNAGIVKMCCDLVDRVEGLGGATALKVAWDKNLKSLAEGQARQPLSLEPLNFEEGADTNQIFAAAKGFAKVSQRCL